MENKWVPASTLPSPGEYADVSKDVIVTDGQTVGHGYYDYDTGRWEYTLLGKNRDSGNDIVFWIELPELPVVDS